MDVTLCTISRASPSVTLARGPKTPTVMPSFTSSEASISIVGCRSNPPSHISIRWANIAKRAGKLGLETYRICIR